MTGSLPRAWRQGWAVLLVSAAARLVLATLAVLLAVSVLPSLAGWQSSVVMSGSMAPTLSPGDVVVVRPVAPSTLSAGEIVLVDDPDVPGQLRMHRIADVDGDRLRLRGDASPQADSSLVPRAAVHGVGALRLPRLGLPAVWASEGDLAPLAGTALALAALVALALLHRSAEAQEVRPAARRRWLRRPSPRVLALGAAVVTLAALPGTPGARAVFSATTANSGNRLAAATYWTCGLAATGAGATQYYPLQETAGPTAADGGSLGSSANGTYSSGGVTYGARGPRCASGQQSAVTLDGASGQMWTPNAVTDPQTFTVQIWFATATTSGGKLIGFGTGTGGATSGQYDRHVYMLNSGQLSFGVYDGATHVVTSANAYNDGAWHLATATFSGSTGMTLYVDGAQVGRDASVTSAEHDTGYWRVGYDNLNAWPNRPASDWFAGSLAQAAVFPSVLSASAVAAQYGSGPLTCAQAAGPSGSNAGTYLPLQESGGTVAVNAGTAGSAGNGTYAGSGVTYGRVGPNCGTNASGAVRLDGASGQIWTSQLVAGPQSFTVQIWFATTTAGGMLLGLGDAANGGASANYDRHIYMSDGGALYFGVWNGGAYTVSSPGPYNDGAWHLATGTFSPATGVQLYVDGVLVGTNTQTTAAQVYSGYWRIGHDSMGGGSWPGSPSNSWYTGRLAQVSIYDRALAADEVAAQWAAGH